MATSSPLGSTARTNELLSAASKQTGISAPTFSDSPTQVSNAVSSSMGNAVVNGMVNGKAAAPEDMPGFTPTYKPVNTSQPQPDSAQAQINPSSTAPQALVDQVNKAQGQVNSLVQNKNLQPGANGTYSAVPTSDQYKQAHEALNQSGVSTPNGMGAGSAGAQTALKSFATPPNPVQQTQGLLAQTPEYQKFIKDANELTSTPTQDKSLLTFYKNLESQYDIPGIDTQLVNTKKIIDGTESDIRNEVTAAGGFATNSQVVALAGARNKQLITNYNSLLQQKQLAQDQVNTMTNLYGQDRTFAHQAISDQLNIDEKMLSARESMMNAAQEGYKTIISAVGLSGLYNGAMNTDPTGYSASLIAQSMNMSPQDFQQAAIKDGQQRQLDMAGQQLRNEGERIQNQKNLLEMNDASGKPNPATAGKPGYTDNGIKYTNNVASQEINDFIKNNGLTGSRNLLSPNDYNRLKASWVKNGLKDSDFDSIYGGMKDPSLATKKVYN